MSEAKYCQLRIELQEIEPVIWRTVRVPSAVTLARLHRVFQIVMGWTNSHLHEFTIGATRYGRPDREFEDDPVLSDQHVTLAEALPTSIRRFHYRYDFGDCWDHEVTIEDVGVLGADQPRVLCLAGANACPPEDVGGPPGYAEFLRAIRGRRHPEHHRLLAWCGGAFDPSGFDLQAVNARLRRLRS